VVVIDTHALIQAALQPHRLSAAARKAMAGDHGPLAASDITFWEIAMLVAKRRLDLDTDAVQLIEDLVHALEIRVLPITPRIAVLAQSDQFGHGDPADRIIGATAIAHGAALVSVNKRLRRVPGLRVLW
jgi:PIN domain nuclease of toxin-antitoxin system